MPAHEAALSRRAERRVAAAVVAALYDAGMSDRGGGDVGGGSFEIPEVPERARPLDPREVIFPADMAKRLRELFNRPDPHAAFLELAPPVAKRLAAIESQLATVLERLDIAAQVQRLELHPGDRLVLHLPYQLHPEHRAGVAENLARLLPEGVKPFILDGGVELSVLSADATDAALRDDALRAARAHLVDPSPAARERLEKALDQVKG